MKRRVADIVFDVLVEEGITDCFAVVGGGAMHLDNAMGKNDKINCIFNHHEQASAMAAEAYARVSGRIAAVCVTSGPGASNAITGVVGAYQDSIPLIVLSGQVRYATMAVSSGLPLRYRGVQELNIVPMISSITKYSVMVVDPLSIRREVRKAVRIAMSGRRGPVWVDIPLDVQSAIVDTDDLLPDDTAPTVPLLSDNEAEEILDILDRSNRPCILSGTGIISANTKARFLDFIDRVDVPVVGGGWCPDIMGTNHPHYYGLSGDIGPRAGNFILQNADVILVLGNSLSFRQTGFAQDKFAPTAKIFYVDIDEDEAKKPGLRISRFFHTDLGAFFDAMSEKTTTNKHEDWFEYCNRVRARFTPFESIEEGIDESGRVNSYYFWSLFDRLVPFDQVITMGNSRVNAAKLQIGVETQQQRAITNYLCGSMGYDLPAAVGVSVATGSNIICVTGDGSIMMNLQELQTISHNHLPVKVILFSNDGYEAIRQTNLNFFGGLLVGCSPESGISFPDFHLTAEGFGFTYMLCSNNGELEQSLKDFLSFEGRAFLEVRQQIPNPVVPKLMSRMNPDGSFQTPALQDMAPFISSKELNELMKVSR